MALLECPNVGCKHPRLELRMRARSLVITFILVVAAAGCSSSKKSSDTTVAAPNVTLALDATTVAPDTSVAVDTTAGSSASEATGAADTTVASPATVASNTTVASGATVAAPSADVLITGFLQSMNGGKVPSAKDIKCVSSKVDPAALAALGASSTGATPDPKILLPVVKSIFSCKPDGLVESLSSSLGTMPTGVTAEQTKCIASGLVDVMGSDDKLLELTMTTGSLKELPKADRDAVVAKLTPTVNKCVDGDLRAKVLAELQK